MKTTKHFTVSALLLLTLVGGVGAQSVEPTSNTQGSLQWIAAKRQVLAVRYNENKQTTVTMAGTARAPRVRGKADVEFKQGRTNVRLEMESFANPQSLGGFYTTYILWAIAPEGQTENLMELPIQQKFKIESTTKFQTFGLIITAEPHARVELPGPMIVAENALRSGTEGALTASQIDYSGDPGTFYTLFSDKSSSASADYNTPLMILGARRAIEIAERADARTFADTELRTAEAKLTTLEQAWPRSRKPADLRKNAKQNSGLAHDVMRLGEQARKLSVERSDQARLTAERQQSGDNLTQAQAETERARTEANRASAEAGLARNDALQARTETERANAEAERVRSAAREQLFRADNETAAARTRVAQAQSDTEKANANAELARAETARAQLQTAEANRERDAAQRSLFVSLSAILETRREARGLIVNLSDVLFDTGQTTLKPGAREKLSKLAGLLIAYSGTYQIEVEGHTDSVGSADSNLNLSRGRAEAVRDYLQQNGIKAERLIAARGLGEANPVADNETAAGRQSNRRVEIIIAEAPLVQAKAGNQ